MFRTRTLLLIIASVGVAGSIVYFQYQKPERNNKQGTVAVTARLNAMGKEEKTKQYQLAKEITTPDGFINIEGISVSEFIGKKIVLLDFWTYSCINCQRTTPYLNAWYDQYKDDGLVIIGVHTPEFEFEKNYHNVKTAVEKFGIHFPVVLDNDYSTWTAYGNRYWPRKYLIDIDGYVVYDHIGEGGYEETEQKIRDLLAERTSVLGTDDILTREYAPMPDTAQRENRAPRSPEIYFGASRNTYLGNGKTNTVGVQTLSEPASITPDTLYLTGTWDVQNEFAQNKTSQSKIIFRYEAENVYFVGGAEKGVKIKIKNDGILVNEIIVTEHTLYPLIKNTTPGAHTLELIIEESGLSAFTFTFG